jgi:hypothetical protein
MNISSLLFELASGHICKQTGGCRYSRQEAHCEFLVCPEDESASCQLDLLAPHLPSAAPTSSLTLRDTTAGP